ncbi:multidrug resistance efflux transporter family protein [Paenisporosarcina cavernae]|uniref:Multidrug resistance efflux transporter family protein n=1 Tax=Paenisporosarcina cavernae TaxID=2320858 RepID=A0A385YVN0_9BACL|nr:multidrug resistance efflux transporter family protein [Paenisporosarcina cavernae]AYC30531.1 multidrug resistance efflux transporter family protein [Paenisporosarcina cavernae]
MRPIILGVFASLFFAVTFVLNASMEEAGGSWLWSASLRYFFMVPLLLLLVGLRRNLCALFMEMKRDPVQWLVWSFVGFGLFYAPITFAAAYAPGWLIAGTWQVTIVSGAFLAPLFFTTLETKSGQAKVRHKIAWRGVAFSSVMLLGIVLMQLEHAETIPTKQLVFGLFPVLIASFSYPLGNRKMMEVCDGRIDAYQRVLGMTIASLPFWVVLAIVGANTVGPPSLSQVSQSFLVAVFSGVIATVLFFMATDLVRGDMTKLAAVEATQSLEVLFALGGEIWLLSIAFPSSLAWGGMLLVVVGMIIHSNYSRKPLNSIAKSGGEIV